MICDKEDGSNDQQSKNENKLPQSSLSIESIYPKTYGNILGILQRELKRWLDLRSFSMLGVQNEWEGHGNTHNEVASDKRREEKVGEQ